VNRALFLGGLSASPGLAPREFALVPLARPPGKTFASWQRAAAAAGVELGASWLLAARTFPAVAGEVSAAFSGVVTGLDAAAVPREIRRLDAAALRSRVLTDFAAVGRRCGRLRRAGRRLVFTNGVFDLFHVGHLRLLRAARRLGDVLVVGINSDESARRVKGRGHPVMPQFARAELVAGAREVDLVVIFPQDDPRELLETVRPHVLVKGAEYTPRQVVGRDLVERWGGRIQLVPHVPGWSSSALLRSRRV